MTNAAKTLKTTKAAGTAAPRAIDQQVAAALLWLKKHGDKTRRDEMGPRYGVHTDKAWGVAMADMLKYAKQLGRNHDLALALWNAEWYEARMVACMVDEPEKVTPVQMERWCKDFDNWGICDTVCFKLFDQSPHAWAKVGVWAKRKDEFQKRAGFALLACLALHGRDADDAQFANYLPLIEAHANDERNFVKKAVNWALRAIGGRNAELKAAAVAVAQRLAISESASARWIGKDALKELAKRTKAAAR
jgi:3-methyladenine DNA glycosylase AlkD